MAKKVYILVEVTGPTPEELAMTAIINSGPFEIVDVQTADEKAVYENGGPIIEFP